MEFPFLKKQDGEGSPEKASSTRNSGWVIYSVVLLSAMLVLGGWYYTTRTINEQARAQFEKETSDVVAMVQNRIEAYINASYGIKALFSASDSVSREEFSTYVKELALRERYPGLVAIYYAPFIEKTSLGKFTQAVRKEGYADFKISPEETEGYVINYIEPYNLYKSAHGFIASSDPVREKAMIQARDSGKPAITERVSLENAERTERAFIVYFPIYKNGMPTYTVKERQVAIAGFVGAVFNATSFFQSVIGDSLGDERVELSIYDNRGIGDTGLFYKNTLFAGESEQGTFAFKKTISIDIAASTWIFDYSTLEQFGLSPLQEILPFAVLLAGIIFVILLFLSLYTLSTGKERALAIVDKMTADLRIYADIVKNMSEALLIFRRETSAGKDSFVLTLNNPVSEKSLKKNPDEILVGKTFTELFPHLEENHIASKLGEVMRSGESYEYEDTRDTAQGAQTFLTRAFAMPNNLIGITYIDITERKKIQETIQTHSDELQKLNSYMVDRELKMVELKEELARLKGEPAKKGE